MGCSGSEASSVDAAVPRDADLAMVATDAMDAAAVDASRIAPDAGPKLVQVGTGSNQFEALTPGQTVSLVLGPQGGGRNGGYHIWSALKTVDLNPDRINVTIELLSTPDRSTVVTMSRALRLQDVGDGHAAFGIRLAPPDCCTVADRPVIMRVAVEDVDQRSAEDEVEVNLGLCLDDQGADVCR